MNFPFTQHTYHQIKMLLKWLLIITPLAVIVGSINAFFLWLLSKATDFRISTYDNYAWIIYLLPLAGVAIIWAYRKFGKNSEGGNNLILDEIHASSAGIPGRMSPFVLFSTVITHLFGGSAGREGTAVQIGGATAEQLGKLFRLDENDHKLILIAGVAAGFGSIFGTPFTGAIFALEVLYIGRMRYNAIIPALYASVIANFVTVAWGTHHSHNKLSNITDPINVAFNMDIHFLPVSLLIIKIIVASIAFGLAGYLFGELTHQVKDTLKKHIKNPYLIPVVGGAVVIAIVTATQNYDYIGIGVKPYHEGGVAISTAFQEGGAYWYSWISKLVLTAITLGAGFKGGEVTPLFFVGATLGNTMGVLLDGPIPLFAALGFIGVFSAATNTPLACTIMGVELFGSEYFLYFALACFTAYYFSGHTGIYTSQKVHTPKHIGSLQKFEENLGQLRKKGKHLRPPKTNSSDDSKG
ncbi:voltage-gated chloride channel family protein [Persicobacter psychrovividus]|uniref:Voltage-gated chloride channel protein n=1 Tax=Persicobacter psychrovividus TaxID=387638 RepID=A0ABN6L644_9BACT|nr:voltage-gated chloride channel protein [Persicobacter psychrovividus]